MSDEPIKNPTTGQPATSEQLKKLADFANKAVEDDVDAKLAKEDSTGK